MAVRSLKLTHIVSRNRQEVGPGASLCHSDETSLDPAASCFIARTVEVWRKPYGTVLTEAEAREPARNMSQFLDILAEWDRAAEAPTLLHHPDQQNGDRT